jgi:hypothetical protein
MLYKYCAEREIPHKRLGKLIVATGAAEIAKLDMLLESAKRNGVDDLQMMEGSQATEMEPELRCLKALLSPSTGIVDSHSFMLSLLVLGHYVSVFDPTFLFVFFGLLQSFIRNLIRPKVPFSHFPRIKPLYVEISFI